MKTGNTLAKSLALSAALLALYGCGKSQEEKDAETRAIAESAAQEAVAESEKESEQKIADVKADLEAKLDTEKAKMQEQMKNQLAQQSAELKSQYAASNDAIKSQLASLTAKYESLKDKLPENVNTTLQTKLPELQSSVSKLEGLVSQFSPSTMEQLTEFQSKYETELGVAKKIADEILKLMGKGTLDSYLPKL